MTLGTGLIIACVVVCLVGVGWVALSLRNHYGWGRVAHGVAVILTSLGLYFSGLMALLWDGIKAVVEWARHVSVDNVIATGLGLLIAAFVSWILGTFLLSRGYGRWTSEQRQAARHRQVATGKPRQEVSDTGTTGPTAKKSAPVDDDMAEIEAILKNRGIN